MAAERETAGPVGENFLTERTGHMALGGFIEVRGAQGTRLVELNNERSSLGRASTNDVVVLLDPSVSRLHAVIERYTTGFCIRDLGSANGTFVNGEPVRGETRLRTGDEIRLGDSRLTFFTVNDDDSDVTAVTDGPPILTRRERELLLALCRPLLEGAPFAPPAGIKQMAAELFVSEAAVKFHLGNLYDKFGLSENPDGGPSRRVVLASEAIRRRAVTISDLRATRR
jgi:pSer/pThr/pTyr-binding forkhead associated (FHA) protein